MQQKESQANLREMFLTSFVKQLLNQSYKPQPRLIQMMNIMPTQTPSPLSPQMNRFTLPNIPSMISPKIKPRMPIPQMPQLKIPAPIPVAPKPGEPKKTVNLGKVTQFLIDPSVFAVECPGAGKNLLVNRAGVIQASAIKLSKEDIEALMKEISATTKIPLTTGLFKAAFQDLLITAVLSDFIETRFIIQKRTPFQ